jgi:protein O-GlcNAc transferase
MLIVIGLVLISVASAETAILGLKTTTDNSEMVKDSNFYFSLGNFLAREGYFKSAERFVNIGLKIDDSAVAHHNLGVMYYKEGKLDLAEQEFEKAIEINSDYGRAYYSLALLQVGQGNLEQGLINLVKTTKLEPDNYKAFFDTGIVLGKLDRFAEAKEYFKKASVINPDFFEAKQNFEFLTEKGY